MYVGVSRILPLPLTTISSRRAFLFLLSSTLTSCFMNVPGVYFWSTIIALTVRCGFVGGPATSVPSWSRTLRPLSQSSELRHCTAPNLWVLLGCCTPKQQHKVRAVLQMPEPCSCDSTNACFIVSHHRHPNLGRCSESFVFSRDRWNDTCERLPASLSKTVRHLLVV